MCVLARAGGRDRSLALRRAEADTLAGLLSSGPVLSPARFSGKAALFLIYLASQITIVPRTHISYITNT